MKCGFGKKCRKVRWSARRTNEELLEMVDEKRSLMDRVTRSKKKWIGHVVRGDGLLKEVTEDRMDCKRPRGRRNWILKCNKERNIRRNEENRGR